jgi:hypothetical protein
MMLRTEAEVTVMRHMNRTCLSVCGAAAILGGLAGVAAADAVPAEVVPSQWQHHQVKFNYVGFTTLYTCDGLEDHVRQIFLHLGARKDISVRAAGCPGPGDTPSHDALVNADFYTLAPATDANNSNRVQGHWTPLEVTPKRPNFMGDGDCELIQELKPVITQNFTLRNVEYRTDCFPHEITLNGFSVKGQALRLLPLG